MHTSARAHCGKVDKVLVDGADYTNVAVEADDITGEVICLEWDGYPAPPPAKAKFKHRSEGVRKVTVTGRVEIILKPGAVL